MFLTVEKFCFYCLLVCNRTMDTSEATEETWKPIPGYPNYEASTFGNIKNVVTGKMRKQNTRVSGYKHIALSRENSVPKCFQAHRLVALTFIPNPDDLPTVDHIDRDPGNNRCCNLRWASLKQQARNRVNDTPNNTRHSKSVWMCDKESGERITLFDSVNLAAEEVRPGQETGQETKRNAIRHAALGAVKTAYGFIWKYDPAKVISGEIWKKLDPLSVNGPRDYDSKYSISDHGRLKDPRGVIRIPYKGPHGYGLVSVNRRGYLIHRLVAMNFLDRIEGKDFVNHKNGNKADPRLSNLEFVDRRENAIHAVEIGLFKTIGVTQYSLDGTFMKTHQSIGSASRELGVGRSGLEKALKKKSGFKGYQFRREDDKTPVTLVSDSHMNRRILQYSLSGCFIRDFTSTLHVQRELGFPKTSLHRAIKAGNAVFRGFRFKYAPKISPGENVVEENIKKRKR